MTDRVDEIAARWAATTEGPWWSVGTKDHWRLYGVGQRFAPQAGGAIPRQVVKHQILKAPKHGTPYAEYWPSEADGVFIENAWDDVRYLISEVARLRELPEQIATAISESCRIPDQEHLGGNCTFGVCAEIAREVGRIQLGFDDLLEQSTLGTAAAKAIRDLMTEEDWELFSRLMVKIAQRYKEQSG